jgi:hypothetical protein
LVLLTLVTGRKGPNDTLVLLTAYAEPLSFSEFLFLAKHYLDSEDSYYPIEKGYVGKAMLLNALNEISCHVPFDKVLERYGLKRKKSLNVIDKRKPSERMSQEEIPLKRSLQIQEGKTK